jgi:hypothetical protein
MTMTSAGRLAFAALDYDPRQPDFDLEDELTGLLVRLHGSLAGRRLRNGLLGAGNDHVRIRADAFAALKAA